MAEKDKKDDEKYNMLKEFEGSRYSGMKVGASHKWYYDQGAWRERKVTPEEWDVYYETVKRRAGKAPEGSGAPVGTEYNWLIVAHQRVDKLDANSYMTCLDGKKFKVAHKRASKDKWSITEKSQRKKVIRFLQKVIDDLIAADENEPVPYTVGKQNRIYGLDHKTKTELYEMASKRDIRNRSKMSREELLDAIRSNDGHQSSQTLEQSVNLKNKTKEELYQMAQRRSIPGRSEMKKKELLQVLKKKTNKEPI